MPEGLLPLVRFRLRTWARSRGPLLWGLFLGAWGWFNWETFRHAGADAPWWSGWSALAAWLGFLAGYDTYARLRETGALRLILLHPVPRRSVALGLWSASVFLVTGALLAFLVLVALLRPIAPDPGTVGSVLLATLTASAFIGYAQLGSLVFPRDVSAVLGFLVVVLGSARPDAWIPAGAPAWLDPLAQSAFVAFPTVHRLNEALGMGAPTAAALAVPAAQTFAALLATGLILRRAIYTRRPDS